jgi:hypothetical protein
MKKIYFLFLINILITAVSFPIFADADAPSIILPKIDIEMQDIRELQISMGLEESKIPEIRFDTIPRPDFTEALKIDLEKTLPEKIDSPQKQKPIDAVITFGYGLNNRLLADFSIFIKQYNPKVSINYHREALETYWFNRPEIKNSYSIDDLESQLLFSYKIFELGAELGYYAKSYDLQKVSAYNGLAKKILSIDLGPSLKFNNQNDLTLRVLNTFLFNTLNGEVSSDQVKRDDLDYMLQTDIVYTQVFGSNHYFTADVGYDFNYLSAITQGNTGDLVRSNKRYFFNSIKAGLSYSTTIKDAFQLKATTDFVGMFRGTEFFWYLIPLARFGYSLQDFFQCYVEGGAKLIEKPGRYWFKDKDYVILPADITPGYHWFAKTGVKASYTGWISVYIDFEYAYNMNGLDWAYSLKTEKLYTLTKRSFHEADLDAGLIFNARDIFECKVDWLHRFLGRMTFDSQDELSVKMTWAVPKTGLSFLLEFDGKFFRTDLKGKLINNVYLMNTGIDWNWHERIGVGTKFYNILYFQQYQIMPGYDEPGFGFLAYVKVGF